MNPTPHTISVVGSIPRIVSSGRQMQVMKMKSLELKLTWNWNAELRRDQSKDSYPLKKITQTPPNCGQVLNLEECVYLEYIFQSHRVFEVSIRIYKPCHIPLNGRCLIRKSDYGRPAIPIHLYHVQTPKGGKNPTFSSRCIGFLVLMQKTRVLQIKPWFYSNT